MGRGTPRSGGSRAVVAVAALYALLLQLFLLGALPSRAVAGLHDANAICAPSSGSDDRGEAPAPHAGTGCCLFACGASPALAPPPAVGLEVPPPRLAAEPAGPAAVAANLPRAPPRHAHTPRGPPTA